LYRPRTQPLRPHGVGDRPWWDDTTVRWAAQRRVGYQVMKRGVDLALTLAVTPAVLPLCLLIAAAIKIDSPDGPVLFVQQRMGKGGRRFPMFKFRTMVRDAEELKSTLWRVNAAGESDGAFKADDDPRITRLGRFLRKSSLDELPQILNILRGEMTWVGPRPTSFGLLSYDIWHTERLEVHPGITGLWQVCARSSVDLDERMRWDLRYIQRRSLLMDLKIMLRTVVVVVQQKGAK
jgi:lipopolysaccharide/colanic/teichoic acid biosynthesis glycosyltransferase